MNKILFAIKSICSWMLVTLDLHFLKLRIGLINTSMICKFSRMNTLAKNSLLISSRKRLTLICRSILQHLKVN